jgi:hypothetical protein
MEISGVADERTRRRAGKQTKTGVTYTHEQAPLLELFNYRFSLDPHHRAVDFPSFIANPELRGKTDTNMTAVRPSSACTRSSLPVPEGGASPSLAEPGHEMPAPFCEESATVFESAICRWLRLIVVTLSQRL